MPAPSGDPGFIGPLPVEVQAWADDVLATDSAAALFEPLTSVLRRREAQVAASYADAALLFQLGSDEAWPAVRQAIAQARALAWLSPSDAVGCPDCLLAEGPCERHQRLAERRHHTRHERRPGADPEWRRFGSEAT